jgi:hypothetical protein
MPAHEKHAQIRPPARCVVVKAAQIRGIFETSDTSDYDTVNYCRGGKFKSHRFGNFREILRIAQLCIAKFRVFPCHSDD